MLNISLIYAQNDTIIVDKIIARIGDEIILKSEVEENYTQASLFSTYSQKPTKCNVLEDLMTQKLLINQAKIDSISVTDDEVENQVKARLNYFINQAGSVEQLETYYNKPIYYITEDLKKMLKEQFTAEREKEHVVGDVSITPSEVAEYFAKIPVDSIPLVEESFEIRVIYFYPKLTPDEEQITIDKLKDIRDKIVSGERKFESMARMYSQDPGSARQGGELGFMSRGELDPDFASVAFSLDSGEVSDIVKTKFGFHIIQLIERKGQRVNVRHILIKPYISIETQQNTVAYADSIRQLIIDNKISFSDAAIKYSTDKDTKNSGGLMFNPTTESTMFKLNELNAQVRYEVGSMNEGDISEPLVTTDDYGNTVIKIYKIEKRVPEHRANLKDDYQLIYNIALNKKKESIFDTWVSKTIKKTYINIDKSFRDCEFKYNWTKKN